MKSWSSHFGRLALLPCTTTLTDEFVETLVDYKEHCDHSRLVEMSEEFEAIKKKRKFLRKSVTDTLKSVKEVLSVQDNHAMIQVLKDNIASKWSNLQDVQATMCTLLEDEEIDKECSSHNDYELRVIEYMSKMTKYLECKSVSEMKTHSSATVTQSCPKVQVKLPKIDLPTFDGNVLCCQPYYQLIKVSVVDNSVLAEVQKLEYLMRSSRVQLPKQ